MSICRHELGGQPPNLPGNSNPVCVPVYADVLAGACCAGTVGAVRYAADRSSQHVRITSRVRVARGGPPTTRHRRLR